MWAKVDINKQGTRKTKAKDDPKNAKQAIKLGVNRTKSQHKITSQNERNKTLKLLQENKAKGKFAQCNEPTNCNTMKQERKRQKPS